MNTIVITGRLGQHPELKKNQKTSYVNFSLADRNGKMTQWVNVTAFGANAENLCQFKKKGDIIAVSGRLLLTEKDGKKYVQVNASEIEYLNGGNNNNGDDPFK
jgi:single-stranded DNA-binding protein